MKSSKEFRQFQARVTSDMQRGFLQSTLRHANELIQDLGTLQARKVIDCVSYNSNHKSSFKRSSALMVHLQSERLRQLTKKSRQQARAKK